jgi:hypothetical protein
MSREKKDKKKIDDIIFAITAIEGYKKDFGKNTDINIVMSEISEIKLKLLGLNIHVKN